jgi:histidinol-phosphate aminotransferase
MLQPDRHLAGLSGDVHGGIDYAEITSLGLNPDDILDFSVNVNPFGPPPGLEKTLRNIPLDRYPDSNSAELAAALAEYHKISQNAICIGAGTTELIRAIATAYVSDCDSVLIPQPAYSDYEFACRLAGAAVIRKPVAIEPEFTIDVPQIIYLIKKQRPKALFLCNPNNPTGQYLSRDNIDAIVSSAPDTLIVLDEAYIAFTENAWGSAGLIDRNNVIILHSMTKNFALAALRIGYALAHPDIVSILRRVLPPWNVNAFAQKAALESLKAQSYLDDCTAGIVESKRFLIKELTGMGFAVVPSKTNFFLVRIGDAKKIRQALLAKKMLVRDCTSFGLASYIRIAPRKLTECRKLIHARKKVIKELHDS